ncbi:MAG: phage tail protein [Verrucomicrobia bacterium]|nr:phage tail protein [Verrucomicrobiota bacterium]
MAETGKRKDPFRGFNFQVQISNTSVAGFRECSGLSFTTDPVEYREGTDKALHPRKLTGLRKFANISLKRGVTDNQELWKWYKNVLNGKTDRRNGSIVLRNEEHQSVMRWKFENAFITKYETSNFNATGNDVTIETIELAVERVEIE